jgi:hypothetical protein
MPDERLDERTRAATDVADDDPALPDQDLFLALGLRIEPDVDEPVVQLDDLRGDRVRQLLPDLLQRLLPHQLGDARLERHVGVRVGGVVHRPLGQE